MILSPRFCDTELGPPAARGLGPDAHCQCRRRAGTGAAAPGRSGSGYASHCERLSYHRGVLVSNELRLIPSHGPTESDSGGRGTRAVTVSTVTVTVSA